MARQSLSNPGVAAAHPWVDSPVGRRLHGWMLVRAVLFDFGGTLDGAGVHWLERFVELYRDAGLGLSFDRVRDAFDHATRCAYADRAVANLGLQPLIEFHVARQLERLGLHDGTLAARVIGAFVDGARARLAESRAVLERLRPRVALGVVSNFYGNVDRLLDEAGIAPLLATIIDSTRVGLSKPDPEIFALAVRQLACEPGTVLYVGDSFEKDVVAAHAAGLRTAWLVGPTERPCPCPEIVDLRLQRLADLEAIIE